jgi:hypothetical protein
MAMFAYSYFIFDKYHLCLHVGGEGDQKCLKACLHNTWMVPYLLNK